MKTFLTSSHGENEYSTRSRIIGKVLGLAVLASLLGLSEGRAQDKPSESADGQKQGPKTIDGALKQLLPTLRKQGQLVGLAAKVMVDGKVIAEAADGERSKGSGVAVSVEDKWHIGSVTKSITATALARLIEKKQLRWDETIGESLADLEGLHDEWKPVTLAQLLTHTSGAPANFSFITMLQRPPEGPKRVEARRTSVREVLAAKPNGKPGEIHRYSNVGYTIAAVIAEKKTGLSWEELVRNEVFAPLELESAGFGPPRDDKEKLDQPRGHQNLGPFKLAVGVDADNSPIIGPAGTVHLSLHDLCVYGNEHLLGELGAESKLLKPATYKRLHTPALNDYACGWVTPEENRWTQHRIIWHNGSNTMWFALLVIVPKTKTVFAITSNDGSIRQAQKAAFQIVKEISAIQDENY